MVYIFKIRFGEVSEWSKEAVLKTVEPRGSGGSNPPFSVKSFIIYWRGARAAESGSLLRSCTGDGTGGSNPPLSVFFVLIAQMDRALDCGSKGRRFESSWVHVLDNNNIQLERCESGRIGRIRNPLYRSAVPRVRIPLSPYSYHILER